jgi:hypothetical protein
MTSRRGTQRIGTFWARWSKETPPKTLFDLEVRSSTSTPAQRKDAPEVAVEEKEGEVLTGGN